MARKPRDNAAFAAALCKYYDSLPSKPYGPVAGMDELVKIKPWAEGFAKTRDPMETAEIVNRIKTTGATVNAWFLRAKDVEKFDDKTGKYTVIGPGMAVLLPNGRTYTYAYKGDAGALQSLTPVKVSGITMLHKIYEQTTDYVSLEAGSVKLESHTDKLPSADVDYLFAPGGDGEEPGVIFRIGKDGTVRGDSGDNPVFGIYTVRGGADDVKVSDGRFDKKKRPSVQAVVTTPSNRLLKAKFYNVQELMQRHALDETSTGEEWAEALAGRRFAACGKIGALHPRGPADFEEKGTEKEKWHVLADAVAGLEQAGGIEKYSSKAGNVTLRMNLSKVPKITVPVMKTVKDEKTGQPTKVPTGATEEVQPAYINVGNFKVYKLEKKGDAEWQASVLATDVGGMPWLSLTPGEVPEDENKTQYGEGFFCIWLDDIVTEKAPVDVANNPFAQAMVKQGLAKFT